MGIARGHGLGLQVKMALAACHYVTVGGSQGRSEQPSEIAINTAVNGQAEVTIPSVMESGASEKAAQVTLLNARQLMEADGVACCPRVRVEPRRVALLNWKAALREMFARGSQASWWLRIFL